MNDFGITVETRERHKKRKIYHRDTKEAENGRQRPFYCAECAFLDSPVKANLMEITCRIFS
jgi:hypothetical protein